MVELYGLHHLLAYLLLILQFGDLLKEFYLYYFSALKIRHEGPWGSLF